MFRLLHRRSERRRRGAALVEAAIALPIFFLTILAIVEFGRAMMVGQLVTNAAREGARQGILYGSADAEVRDRVATFLQNAADIEPEHVDVQIDVAPGPDREDAAPEGVVDAQSGDRVTVRVTVPWDQASWGVLRWLGGESFQGEATMRHE
ncbi:TadE/TadG family type IV pilus assembly protein [Alienimonas sp. DA493]|uniref:TadE/TadG family type IV pilus assembly protein n=1 Tax=Alienimonas sp. DA493 TaxID=3373605 RepID=UPI003754BCEC